MVSTDVYELLNQEERGIVNEVISEAIVREYGQEALDSFGYNIKGVIED
jgi:hypothetical protein